jgi:hypothetical protein
MNTVMYKFGDIEPCIPLKIDPRFERTCKTRCLLHAGFFRGFYTDPEN